MRTKVFLMIVFLSAFFGCSEQEEEIDIPQIEAKVVGKGVTNYYKIPYLLISVTNIGRTDARLVGVDVYFKKNGNIIDISKFSVRYLDSGETQVREVRLLNLESHDDYESIKINARVDIHY